MRGTTVAAFLGGYLLLDWVSYIYPVQQSAITPWNPHPALAVALLAIGGQRWLPAVAGTVFVAEILVRQMPAGPFVAALVSVVLALGYAAMAAALTNIVGPERPIDTPRQLGRIIAVVMVGTLLTGTLYVAALVAGGAPIPAPYFEALAQFWIGDCVGILVTLPVVLVLGDRGRRPDISAALRDPVSGLQVVSILIALWLVFGPYISQPFKFFYLLFLPLVWISVRSGLLGAALAALVIQFGVIAGVLLSGSPALTVFELQSLLIALAITGLFLGISVDERRRAARDLRDSLRMAAAGEMSAALAHELNQPLAAMAAYSQAAVLMAGDPACDRGRLVDTLDKARTEAARAAEVVRRLRDFFRRGETQLQPSSLPAIAAAAIVSLQARAAGSGVSLEQHSEPGVPLVLADPLQIEVVLRNLLANGMEAALSSPAPRLVQLEVGRAQSGFVRAVVSDSGPGVGADHAQRVFEPFWTSRSSGMGMGLAISRAIVEAHGGRMWVEAAGRGVFGFTIPAAES